ncbi:MAG: sulfatase [Planctomycetota bacterium]
MNPRHSCLSSLLLAFAVHFGLGAPFASVVAAERVNVLMIAVDDLRPELGCYGKDYMSTPNIDALAARGIRFDRAYCQVAVCGASRASLLSGCRPETTDCWDYKTLLRSKMPNVVTLPQHFRNNGYETTFIGKVYHSPTDDPQGWSARPEQLAPKERGKGKGYLLTSATKRVPHPTNKKLKHGPSTENGGDVPDSAYVDGHNADRAVSMLEQLSEGDKPFFFAVGFSKPHLPFNAPARYWDLYSRDEIEIPSREDVVDGVPYAKSGWGELKNYPDIPRDVDFLDDAKTRELIHGYRAATSYMDAQVGRVLATLDRLKIRDNTIVVLWGDHGWYVGDFGDWCKHTNYEIATRVPLIVSLPPRFEIGNEASSEALTEFVDLYPTLCELTGLVTPEHCQGTSFAPVLKSPSRPWKEAAFSQYKKSNRRQRLLGTSLRTARYRYTEWRDQKTGELDATELIDFDVDPAATRNVAADPNYASILPRLAELCKQSGTGIKP